jgi:ectoine hydroxylase-related dioxygenase (phytanoyl-CoA dioxygenase family)
MAGTLFNSLLAMSVQLCDHDEGDGGFWVVRGSHKSNFPLPRAFLDGSGSLGEAHLHQPVAKAGDVIFFSEATVHGAMPWNAEHQRRIALYRFAPATVAYSRAYAPSWSEDVLRGMTPAQRAVLEGPYAARLDRPVLTKGGDEEPDCGAPRPEVKKAFDQAVFGSRYF